MLMFWGVDKKTITRVTLQLNGYAIYEGPLEPLERLKEDRGLGGVEPVVIFFSQDGPDSPYQSTINFSRIDAVTMLLDTETPRAFNYKLPYKQPVDVVRYYAIAVHPLRVADRFIGKVFADERAKGTHHPLRATHCIEDAFD